MNEQLEEKARIANDGLEEGTVILDPKAKAEQEEAEKQVKIKTEKMRAINADITTALKDLSEKHGLKLYLAASCEELDEMGIWKSGNVKHLDEMGLAKLVETQF